MSGSFIPRGEGDENGEAEEAGGGRGTAGGGGGGSCQTFEGQLFQSATSSRGDPWWTISASTLAVVGLVQRIEQVFL